MTAQIAIEAADFAALHTHAANRGEVLQVRFLHLCREVAGATATPAEESPAVPAAPAGLPAVKKLPLPQPPSLTGPGDILDADTIDWTNPNLYK